jgi:hypothetical protein
MLSLKKQLLFEFLLKQESQASFLSNLYFHLIGFGSV